MGLADLRLSLDSLSWSRSREESPIRPIRLLMIVFPYGCFRLQIIDSGVSWGSHYVECELAGEEGDKNIPSFRILGIFAT